MKTISEAEFARIVRGIIEDRDAIVKHNPIGTEEEILLWMLMSCLVSYLSLSEIETPCFTGKPDAQTYRDAIFFLLRDKRESEFDVGPYLSAMSSD